jgi:UDP-glucuronate 4-epimerase
MRTVVTGAAGFIGAHCCCRLLDEGFEVVGLDNFDPFYDRRAKEEGLAPLVGRPGFEFIEGDIRDPAVVQRALAGADVVIHLAARPGVGPSVEQPVAYSSVNVGGTAQLLESCRELGVRRFVFGSSSSVYGDATPPPFREDVAAVQPISPYAATKRAGELLCQVYHHLYGMRIASLRLFAVYGPRQRPDLAIHTFTHRMVVGEAIRQCGDGESERDYTHVNDILYGVLGAVRWVQEDVPALEVFNLGSSRTVTLSRLIHLISRALGVDPRIERHPPRPGDVRRTCADISKARRVLGYNPSVAIEDGIPAFVEWYRNYHGTQHPAAG